MNTTLLGTALAMGLVGSLHCAGMCGPIMLVMPFQQLRGAARFAGLALYHFGRISVYAILGWLLHSFRHLFHPEWQQTVSLTLGAMLLAAGLYSFVAGRTVTPWGGWIQKHTARFLGNPSLPALAIAGILNGLLPCGLVYMALGVAATAGSTSDAVLSMYAFGAGTLPMLLAITILRRRVLPVLTTGSMRRFVPAMLVVMGSLFVLRGANLGIPYLSPKLEIAAGTGEVKSSCCHHP